MGQKMSETSNTILYDGGSVRVGTRSVEVGAVTYPVTKIQTIQRPIRESFQLGGFVVNAALALFGLIALFNFTLVWVLVGLAALALGGFGLKKAFVLDWWIPIRVSDEEVRIRATTKGEIDLVFAAMKRALEDR
jgi:hypothetical protein